LCDDPVTEVLAAGVAVGDEKVVWVGTGIGSRVMGGAVSVAVGRGEDVGALSRGVGGSATATDT